MALSGDFVQDVARGLVTFEPSAEKGDPQGEPQGEPPAKKSGPQVEPCACELSAEHLQINTICRRAKEAPLFMGPFRVFGISIFTKRS